MGIPMDFMGMPKDSKGISINSTGTPSDSTCIAMESMGLPMDSMGLWIEHEIPMSARDFVTSSLYHECVSCIPNAVVAKLVTL